MFTMITMTIKTDDGYTFYILEDGRVTDDPNPHYEDMSWDTIEQFTQWVAINYDTTQWLSTDFKAMLTRRPHEQANNQNTY